MGLIQYLDQIPPFSNNNNNNNKSSPRIHSPCDSLGSDFGKLQELKIVQIAKLPKAPNRYIYREKEDVV
eukprot:scaffold3855_cov144-Amphora_coffeaeformis.AAC.1